MILLEKYKVLIKKLILNYEKLSFSGQELRQVLLTVLYFDLLTRPKMPFQGDALEGGDTF